jgi:Flp pilus assembly protein TadD
MELTIEQTLQQGMAADRKGKLEEAERLYRAILQSQPTHPDANHNLGVIAVSVNKADVALPLFKTALEANPKIEQFWLSYIDALIKEKQFDNAKHVLEQGKNQGVAGKKIDALEKHLTLITQSPKSKLPEQKKSLTLSEKRKKLAEQKKQKKAKKQNLKAISPSESEIKNLLEHYQNGRYDDAEKLAKSITQQFPEHQFAWTILGAVLKQTGRVIDSLTALRKSVKLAPQDAAAHSNLGITLQELGRLDEAEASYTQAIALKPNFAEAHYNLGITLQELGRLGEAESSYTQAIALKPDYAEAHSNLGITLQELGRLDEAEASYTQAIALKPNFAEAHYNLGIMLQELGRLGEAESSYTQVIALKPDYAEAHSNLGITLQELGRLDEAEVSYTQAITLKPENIKAHSRLLMCLFQQDKKSVFFDELDYLINQDKANAIIGSLACRSALKYGLEKPNSFCTKPLNYVLHNDLNTRYDFEKIFVEKAKSILNKNQISNRRQTLLVNGNQTSGNIFDIKNDDTNEIQNIIRFEVEKYQTKFKESEEGLIKKMPAEYSLHGWLISMKSGGNLKPHIHTEGWLSGSIYINVPRKLKVDSGNLVVALGKDNDTTDKRINEKKTINVVTGSMVLFPASLMHYTIPFESEEERIVLAFDVKKMIMSKNS